MDTATTTTAAAAAAAAAGGGDERLYGALKRACESCTSDLIALSGGLDSTIIAHLRGGSRPGAVTVIARDFVSTDLTYCQMAARHAGLPLSIHGVETAEILEGVEETVRILGNFNDIEIRNSVVMYMAMRWARDNGRRSITTGDGADELFAGYGFLRDMSGTDLEAEVGRICSAMHFPAQEIGRALGVGVESPFLDGAVVERAGQIPAGRKVGEAGGRRHGKLVLRRTFDGLIPSQIAWREKSPMQDGAGTAGLTGMFEAVVGRESFEEKRRAVRERDGVTIRSRESMHYYEIFRRLFGPPADAGARDPCPYCGHDSGGSRFCRMCGAFPI